MLKKATVVPGTEQDAPAGTTGARICVLDVPGESLTRAVLKRDTFASVVTEAFCSLLLDSWGLPVPRPFIVDEGDGVAFASADVGYPDLSRRLGVDTLLPESAAWNAAVEHAARLACSLPSFALAATVDEAIGNRDRNLGNILWNGTAEAWIDHAFSIGNGGHLPDVNKLCQMALAAGDGDSLRQSVVPQWTALDRAAPGNAAHGILGIADFTVSAQWVTDRLNHLGMLLLARFPAPRDLLSPQ